MIYGDVETGTLHKINQEIASVCSRVQILWAICGLIAKSILKASAFFVVGRH
jgi:hypothetical protein